MNKKIAICIFLLLGAIGIFAWQLVQTPDSEDTPTASNNLETTEIAIADPYTVTDREVTPLVAVTMETQVDNLKRLGMVWGFTKYTHLAFLTGERCWDEELLYLIPIIRFANPEDVNDILYNWFIGLGDDGFDNDGSVLLLMRAADINWAVINDTDWISPLGSTHRLVDGVAVHFVGFRVDNSYFAALDENDEYFGWLHSLERLNKEDYTMQLVNMDWLTDESFLGASLASVFSRFHEIPIIDRANAPVSFDGMGRSNFPNQEIYADMDYSNVGYRLLGLFRLWNAMKYYFPYIDIIDDDWVKLLVEHIPMMLEGDDRLSYILALGSLSSRLHDAHIRLTNHLDILGATVHFEMLDNHFGNYVAPVRLTQAKGRYLVVEDAIIVELPTWPEQKLQRGDIILRVNGVDINEIIADKLRFVPFPNEEKALHFLTHNSGLMALRQHTRDVPMEIYVLRDGVEIRLEVGVTSNRVVAHHTPRIHLRPTIPYERLDNNIGLINPGLFVLPQVVLHIQRMGVCIQDVMHYFADTTGIIVDMRQRPAHTPFTFRLPEFLVEEIQPFLMISEATQFMPGAFLGMNNFYSGGMGNNWYDNTGWGGLGNSWNENPFFYENNVVILVDEGTMSLPEFSLMSLRNGTNVTVIGRNSIGANGEIRELPLPGGIIMIYTSLGIYTPEGGQTQRIGLPPDIWVYRTVAGIIDGRDEIMEAAIQFLLDSD